MRVEDEIFEFFENLVAEIDTCTCILCFFFFFFFFAALCSLCSKKERYNFFGVVSSCEIYGRILSKFEIRRLLRVDLFFFFSFRVYIKF